MNATNGRFAQFQKRWNLEATDFAEMRPVMNFKNLIHNTATSFWNVLWEDPEQARTYYEKLADDAVSRKERMAWAAKESKADCSEPIPNGKAQVKMSEVFRCFGRAWI